MLTGADIREKFLKFFESKQHTIVPSASLIPSNDPTLMFTVAGMVPFKNVFIGLEERDYKRATSSQRCVRAGGKHNDLENVGHTARHHTFFEMLGNFSFGDYFKEEAITWAWEFVTEHLKLDKSRLLVTIYHDDDEAFEIWHNKAGVPADKIIRIDTDDNFWSMGPTGPCGPCSEIFYDQGEDIFGGPPGSADEDGDRFLEIWNLVFMQFDRQEDGSMEPLAAPGIDTGAGLERLASVCQGKVNNYDTDLFQSIIQATAKLSGHTYGADGVHDASLRVIADHLRSGVFMLLDGVLPSNEGRGYVMRRILRRAMRHAHMLGVNEPLIYKLVPTLVENMGEAYPELRRGATMVQDVIKLEEERFSKTLSQGLKVLEEELTKLNAGDALPGAAAFKLYDTYGFPLDLTADVLKPRGIEVDEEGFKVALQEQKARARAAHKGSGSAALSPVLFDVQEQCGNTEFQGYYQTQADGVVQALVQDDTQQDALQAGAKAIVVTNQTPFYAESGGQVGDSGELLWTDGKATVTDTQKVLDGLWLHHVEITEGTLSKGENVTMVVDAARRQRIVNNHSATHLLHRALKDVLGEHVVQRGSLVNEHKTRFDFSHTKGMSAAEVQAVEDHVNRAIMLAAPVNAKVMPKDDAINAGAEALFGEKYADEVRVLSMGENDESLSVELCGGTHVSNTGQIGLFKVTSESAVSAGVRRIEATTGAGIVADWRENDARMADLANTLKTQPANLAERVTQLQKQVKQLEQNLKEAKKGGAGGGVNAASLASQAEQVAGVAVVAAQVPLSDPELMRELVDETRDQLQSGVVVLAAEEDGKSRFVVGVTKDLTSSVKAGAVVQAAAVAVGGRGGGRPDFAQAGGPAGNLSEALDAGKSFIRALEIAS